MKILIDLKIRVDFYAILPFDVYWGQFIIKIKKKFKYKFKLNSWTESSFG